MGCKSSPQRGVTRAFALLPPVLLLIVSSLAAVSQSASSPQSWGPTVGGLRIGLSIERGDMPAGGKEFLVAFENTSQSDFVLNLGSMLANGIIFFPTEIHLLVTDTEGTTRELTFFVPRLEGRLVPFTVPLRAGSTYTVRTSLRDYFVPTLDNQNVKLPAGQNRIVARFQGRRTDSGNGTIRDVDLLNFWQGVVESNPVALDGPEAPASPQERNAASIAGCIVDQAGYGIPGVSLEAKGNGVVRTAMSNTAGCYTFRDLPPASYRVTARLAGFENVARDDVVVVPGAVTRFDFIMHISSIRDDALHASRRRGSHSRVSTKKQEPAAEPAGGPPVRVSARLERIVKDTDDRWTLKRAVRFTAVAGVRDEEEIYEWRDIGDDNRRLVIAIYHYTETVQARQRVEHLDLVVQSAAIPVDGIGDAAKIATMRPGDPSAPGTVHFSVDWMYVQVSAPTAELATRLAGGMAEELRTAVSR